MANLQEPAGPRTPLAGPRTPPHIGTLILLSGLSALAMNIFLPSLPSMAAHFHTDYGMMQLSVALYLAVTAVVQILIGPVSDKMGRRPVILWGIALYLAATLICIVAPTVELFLLARMGQAAAVVGMVLSRAAVRDLYSSEQSASMIGYVTMGMAVVPMLGPVVGGMLDQLWGWTANFWALALMGALTLWLTYADFGETAHKSGKTLIGQFREYPELLRSPRFWGYSLSSAFSAGAFYAYLGGAPFVGSQVYGLEPGRLGLYFGAPAVGYFVGNFLSGKFAIRLGVNRMVLIGCLVVTGGVLASMALMTTDLGSAESFFGLMVIVGLGNGLALPSATAGALSVRPHLAATASGLNGAVMQGGGAGLSALAGALLTPDTGAWPLLFMMLASSILGVAAIVLVMLRERQLGL
ncbi:multidrug effflux MFS transporter [Pseudodonghicola flavimaris]|uniref:Bcr/CflA family efflux transporter n=1 Tax=Pseudodonghicola flavimaris TaxID=3050036 RepID=A0ABT7F0I7_9RHOB|nr:multidrug effflux MFS transporter [Pseudodonghicola flavimaris]MDK3018114.1 multidrug effflux MFS transporter [Pseudodonghicola flavimaris]